MAEPDGRPRELEVASIDVDVEVSGSGEAAQAAPQTLGRKECDDGVVAPLPKLDKDGVTQEDINSTCQKEDIDAARRISVASLGVCVVVALLAFGIGYAKEVLSLIGFAMEAFLDGVSSALVLWRFKKGKKRQHEDSEAAERFKAERDARRERNSSVGIGITFLACAVLLFFSGLIKLVAWDPATATHEEEERTGAVASILLSIPSGVVFGVLAYKKWALSAALSSQVLRKDALCSMLGAGLAIICGLAAIIEELSDSDSEMAAVDAVASWIIALILGVEGARTLHHNLGGGWEQEHRIMD